MSCTLNIYRKSGTWLGQRELRLFKLLLSYITDPSAAENFIDLILPFFSKKDLNSGEPCFNIFLCTLCMHSKWLLFFISFSNFQQPWHDLPWVFYIVDECLEALRVVKGIVPNLRCKVSAKVLNALNPLLATVGLEQRLCICDIYDGLSLHESSMSFLVIVVIFVMSTLTRCLFLFHIMIYDTSITISHYLIW